jgi:lactoylglutathione lyase
MIQGINSVHVYVVNQSEAVRYYSDILGFEVRRWEPLGPAGSWIEMGPPGKSTALVLYPRDLMPDADHRKSFIILGCENLASTYETLEQKGVTFIQEAQDLGWGTFAVFADPWGNEFALMQVTRAATVPAGAGAPRARGGSMPPPPPPPPPGKRR